MDVHLNDILFNGWLLIGFDSSPVGFADPLTKGLMDEKAVTRGEKRREEVVGVMSASERVSSCTVDGRVTFSHHITSASQGL